VAKQFSPAYVNNVFAQIGLVLLIGLAAKNAILIVEFAREKYHSGMPWSRPPSRPRSYASGRSS